MVSRRYAGWELTPKGKDLLTHTYTLHIAVVEKNDAAARERVEEARRLLELNGIEVLFADVTDSDDWAEHLNVECAHEGCSQPSEDRTRGGGGGRLCAAHAAIPFTNYGPYPIQDVFPGEPVMP